LTFFLFQLFALEEKRYATATNIEKIRRSHCRSLFNTNSPGGTSSTRSSCMRWCKCLHEFYPVQTNVGRSGSSG